MGFFRPRLALASFLTVLYAAVQATAPADVGPRAAFAGAPADQASACWGDEQLAFAPPEPRVGQLLFVIATSSQAHTDVALAGPSRTRLTGVRNDETIHAWHFETIPFRAGPHEFAFFVQASYPCVSSTVNVADETGALVVPTADTTVAGSAGSPGGVPPGAAGGPIVPGRPPAVIGEDEPVFDDERATNPSGGAGPADPSGTTDPSGTVVARTPRPTRTPTPTRTPGSEPEPTDTKTPRPTSTPTPTRTPRPEAEPAEPTVTRTPTATRTPTSTRTPRPTATETPEPTETPRPTDTPRPSATPTLEPPSIDGIEPGAAHCGTELVIRGRGFGPDRATVRGRVRIADENVSNYGPWSPTEIRVVVPHIDRPGYDRPLEVVVDGKTARASIRASC